MFGLILTTFVTFMQVYVFSRIYTLPVVKQKVRPGVYFLAFLFFLTLFVAGRTLGHAETGAVSVILEMAAMIWMAVLFLLLVTLLTVDLLTLFGWLFDKFVIQLRAGAVIVAVILSILAFVQGVRQPAINSYTVSIAGLPHSLDGTTIIALSDLHLGSILGEKWFSARVDQVNDLEPDIVVLLGDILNGRSSYDYLGDLISTMHPRLGIYAVTGNHEYYGGIDKNMKILKRAGIEVLRNRVKEIAPGLFLAGIDDLTAMKRFGDVKASELINKTFASQVGKGGLVLLSHTPWYAKQFSRKGVGLMLSGHTHGGQIWPFGYVVSRFYPLLAGSYEIDGMLALVCRGTGTWGPPMRLWKRGEIIKVKLTAK